MSSNEWQKTTLGSVVNILSGGTPSTRVPEYWADEIKWVTAKDVSESSGYKIYDTDRKISKLGLENSPANIIPKEATVLIARGATMGRCCMLGEDMAINQTCFALTAKEGKTHPYFLFYAIKNLNDFFQKIAHGAIFNTVIGSGLRETEISLPPLPAQRRIADILSALDEKIELNHQTNATLEAIAQSIFREWFVEFNFPGATGETIDSELGMIPKGWKVGKLKDFGDIVCGKTPSKANPNYFGGEIPFIKIPDMHNSVFITKTEDSLTGEGAQSQKNKFILPYSIIVSCIATVGLVSITSAKSQTNQQINAVVPKHEYLPFYLYFRAKELENVLKVMGSGGSATLNVNTTSFSNIDCVIPLDDTLKGFHETTKPLFEKMLSNEHEIATLASLRDTLLPKLMRGDIEVDSLEAGI